MSYLLLRLLLAFKFINIWRTQIFVRNYFEFVKHLQARCYVLNVSTFAENSFYDMNYS
jgi:hypothetical protein